ncbi:sensor histidine kinase [Eilatimonas milleporae]|uniref:histidine kinase n=1 Tax=Eilatimonas milleporae TaxID=911205 RepID=A0A3M0C1X2_9PROT|nr:HAMP domain-containing sensor histidine kinase [Eilatimonas milleporae]RMB02885.1 signal transduction histidine kinase /histidine kinase [Eilatimonas milleporae]
MSDYYRPFTSSLRSRLLLLTILFVTILEALIFVPTLAAFRQSYLEERLVAAQIAALSLEEAPNNAVSPALEQELLATAGVIAVVMRREDISLMLGFGAMPEEANASYDLRNPTLGGLIGDAFEALGAKGTRVIRVMGRPLLPATRFLEITLDEAPLYDAMVDYARSLLLLSLLVSIFTGILVYLALHWLVVRPMRRLKNNIVAFSRQPTRPTKLKAHTRRRDEIGIIERELARMQQDVRRSMQQKARLAELGEAVAKINHDLRNILSTIQLSSGALKRVDHPGVKRVSDRLVNAVSRAIALCERTIRHGRAAEPAPEKQWYDLDALVVEVASALGLRDEPHFRFTSDIADGLTVYGDPDQLHRVIMNLCRNAREVQDDHGAIHVSATKDEDGTAHIAIRDEGPGIPDSLRPTLFKAFQSSGRPGGSGLGLSIARDIVVAHGGRIAVGETGGTGTVFTICLPGEDDSL